MERRYWLHRITGGKNALPFAHPLLFEHGLLSIGWRNLSKDSFIKLVKSQGIKAIDDWMINAGWGLPKNRWNLYRFIHEMKKGDYVIVPYWSEYTEFSVFEISDDKIFSNESIDKSLYIDWNGNQAYLNDRGYMATDVLEYIDLGFYRKVTPVSPCSLHIPRRQYADSGLQKRMKIRQTNADISDLSQSVEDALRSYEQQKPINLKEEIIGVAAPKLLEKIHRYTNPDKFEALVEWYLRSIGANDIDKPRKNESPTEEGDADRVAFFENIKTAIMVQVKKHDANTSTDDWAVQQIKAFRMNHDYGDYFTQMWVISTCDQFSEKAVNEAQNSNVRLINGLEFCKMILDAGIDGLNL